MTKQVPALYDARMDRTKRIERAAGEYREAQALMEKKRARLYREIREAKGDLSVRKIAAATENLITYGRVGQIQSGR